MNVLEQDTIYNTPTYKQLVPRHFQWCINGPLWLSVVPDFPEPQASFTASELPNSTVLDDVQGTENFLRDTPLLLSGTSRVDIHGENP